jgi:hypothetical protein
MPQPSSDSGVQQQFAITHVIHRYIRKLHDRQQMVPLGKPTPIAAGQGNKTARCDTCRVPCCRASPDGTMLPSPSAGVDGVLHRWPRLFAGAVLPCKWRHRCFPRASDDTPACVRSWANSVRAHTVPRCAQRVRPASFRAKYPSKRPNGQVPRGRAVQSARRGNFSLGLAR